MKRSLPELLRGGVRCTLRAVQREVRDAFSSEKIVGARWATLQPRARAIAVCAVPTEGSARRGGAHKRHAAPRVVFGQTSRPRRFQARMQPWLMSARSWTICSLHTHERRDQPPRAKHKLALMFWAALERNEIIVAQAPPDLYPQ